jgi:ABC-type polysaccharide/polyol phosphate transport system ATPase subunit
MSYKPAVSVRSVTKKYRVYSRPHHRVLQWWADKRNSGKLYCHEVKALQDISFDVQPGEAIAIIGRNGSGKSTLLQMITGNLATTSGSVEINGSVSALLELGAGFNPDFSGRENLRLNAAIRGLTTEETARLEPAIEKFADIGTFMDEPVRTYSSGMYVRLAFAVAVHVVPDVLIIDEALAVGDIFFQQKCYEHIANSMQGAAKILVTHDLASIARLATRCLVIDSGELIFDGTPLQAIEVYTSRSLGQQIYGNKTSNITDEDFVESQCYDLESAPSRWFEFDLDERTSNPSNFRVLSISGESSGKDGRSFENGAWPIVPGEEIRIQLDCVIGKDISQPVFGYLVRDRVGNSVFGMNTITQGIAVERIVSGHYVIEIKMTWPEVEAGEYSLTFGLGDGQHGLHHQILGWVQRVVSVISVPDREVHGIFNGFLNDVLVYKYPNDAIESSHVE